MDAVQTIMERLDVLPPDNRPCVFTAPHNIGLRRDGHGDHKQEDFTSFLAREFAEITGCGMLAWSRREIERSVDEDWGRQLQAECRRERSKNRYMQSQHSTYKAETGRCQELADFKEKFEKGSYVRGSGTAYGKAEPRGKTKAKTGAKAGGEPGDKGGEF